jgi:NAD+ synthase
MGGFMLTDMETLAQKLAHWIRDETQKAGGGGVVVGLSGGVDSSVTAVLCQRAFPQNVLAAIMPCHSLALDVEHARLVAEKFHLPTQTIVLDSLYDALLATLPQIGEESTRKIAEANLKPRLRMITLYYLANRLGYLVVGTGNRSELAVGYFTKYGDGGVDLLPLGNLVKTQVRELASHLGIPQEIIEKAPSAGLWAGQTDEGEMGLTYQDLDRYLLTGEAGAGVKERIEALSQASLHKKRIPTLPPF